MQKPLNLIIHVCYSNGGWVLNQCFGREWFSLKATHWGSKTFPNVSCHWSGQGRFTPSQAGEKLILVIHSAFPWMRANCRNELLIINALPTCSAKRFLSQLCDILNTQSHSCETQVIFFFFFALVASMSASPILVNGSDTMQCTACSWHTHVFQHTVHTHFMQKNIWTCAQCSNQMESCKWSSVTKLPDKALLSL